MTARQAGSGQAHASPDYRRLKTPMTAAGKLHLSTHMPLAQRQYELAAGTWKKPRFAAMYLNA
eukprot:1160484-Pelagomonas_calceolata.AAC.5